MYFDIKEYSNKRKCIMVMENDGSCWCKLTVNIPSVPLTDRQVVLNIHNDKKTKSIIQKLIDRKVLSYTDESVMSGYNTYKIVEINYKKLQMFGSF